MASSIGRESHHTGVGIVICPAPISSSIGGSKIDRYSGTHHLAQGDVKDKVGRTCIAFHQAYIVDGDGGGVVIGDGTSACAGRARNNYISSSSTHCAQRNRKGLRWLYFRVTIDDKQKGLGFARSTYKTQGSTIRDIVTVSSSGRTIHRTYIHRKGYIYRFIRSNGESIGCDARIPFVIGYTIDTEGSLIVVRNGAQTGAIGNDYPGGCVGKQDVESFSQFHDIVGSHGNAYCCRVAASRCEADRAATNCCIIAIVGRNYTCIDIQTKSFADVIPGNGEGKGGGSTAAAFVHGQVIDADVGRRFETQIQRGIVFHSTGGIIYGNGLTGNGTANGILTIVVTVGTVIWIRRCARWAGEQAI